MKPIRNQKVRYKEVDGRAILIEPENGKVHEFNPVATLLWNHSDGHHPLELLTEKIVHSFEVESMNAAQDLSEFFAKLDQAGLISWINTDS
ncbi:MAG: PqqD family protein [Bdellovibrionota bacterium]